MSTAELCFSPCPGPGGFEPKAQFPVHSSFFCAQRALLLYLYIDSGASSVVVVDSWAELGSRFKRVKISCLVCTYESNLRREKILAYPELSADQLTVKTFPVQPLL